MGKRLHIEERLRRELARAGVLRSELARQTGMSEAMLSLFVRGKRHIGLRAAVTLAQALGFELVLKPTPRLRKGKGE
jgi:transcriptional regulator with XRE-family HTH domain